MIKIFDIHKSSYLSLLKVATKNCIGVSKILWVLYGDPEDCYYPSRFDREIVEADIVISQPFWSAYLTKKGLRK